MPEELRYILFSWGEVAKALQAYRRRIGKPLPTGTVRQYIPRGVVDVDVDLVIASDHGDETVVSCDSYELGKALVLYCIESDIRLPRETAYKSVRMLDNNLVLTVSIGSSVDKLERAVQTLAV